MIFLCSSYSILVFFMMCPKLGTILQLSYFVFEIEFFIPSFYCHISVVVNYWTFKLYLLNLPSEILSKRTFFEVEMLILKILRMRPFTYSPTIFERTSRIKCLECVKIDDTVATG